LDLWLWTQLLLLGGGHSRLEQRLAAQSTAKLNAVDPHVWLADVLARIADHPVNRVDELLPWKWKVHAETAPLSLAA
jgi:transposase